MAKAWTVSTHVLIEYLKNSVTKAEEPLSVIACLLACFEAIWNCEGDEEVNGDVRV